MVLISVMNLFSANQRSSRNCALTKPMSFLFLTSIEAGVTDADEQVAQILYRANKPVVLAVNKVDNPERRQDIYDFYSLGLASRYHFQVRMVLA